MLTVDETKKRTPNDLSEQPEKQNRYEGNHFVPSSCAYQKQLESNLPEARQPRQRWYHNQCVNKPKTRRKKNRKNVQHTIPPILGNKGGDLKRSRFKSISDLKSNTRNAKSMHKHIQQFTTPQSSQWFCQQIGQISFGWLICDTDPSTHNHFTRFVISNSIVLLRQGTFRLSTATINTKIVAEDIVFIATNLLPNVEDSTVFCCLLYQEIGALFTKIKIPVCG